MTCLKSLAAGTIVLGLVGELRADSFVFDPYQPDGNGGYLEKVLPSVSQVGSDFYLTTISASWGTYDSSGLFSQSGAGPIHLTRLSPNGNGQYMATDLGDISNAVAEYGFQGQLGVLPFTNYEKPILRGDTIAWIDPASLVHWYNVANGSRGDLTPLRQFPENTRSDGNAVATTWQNFPGAPAALSIDNMDTGQRLSLDYVDQTGGGFVSGVDVHADSSTSGRVVFTNAQGLPEWSTYNFNTDQISTPTPFNFLPAATGDVTMNATWVVWKAGFTSSTSGDDLLAIAKWNGTGYVNEGFIQTQLTATATPDMPSLFGDVLAVTDPSGGQIDLYDLNTETQIGSVAGNGETVDSPALWVDANDASNYLLAYESHGSPYSGVATGPFISVVPEPAATGACALAILLIAPRRRFRC